MGTSVWEPKNMIMGHISHQSSKRETLLLNNTNILNKVVNTHRNLSLPPHIPKNDKHDQRCENVENLSEA